MSDKFDAVKAELHRYFEALENKQEDLEKQLSRQAPEEHDSRMEIQDSLNRIQDKLDRLDKALDALEN